MRRSKTIISLSALLTLSACPGPEPVPPGPGPVVPEFSSVSVTCESTAFPANEKTKCSATALDQDGKTLESTATWSSSNPDVATVDAAGNVEARSTGPVELKVTSTALSETREARVSLSIVGTSHKETALTQGATWTQKGSPHLVANLIDVKDGAALVLEAGAEVRFAPKAGLRITQGTLQATGTEQARVRLVAQESTPAKGSWKGVAFAGATAGSALTYATLSGCGQVEDGDPKAAERACLTVETDKAPLLQQVSIENSGSAGVALWGADWGFTPDSKALQVTGSAGYAVRMSANQADTVPAESVFTDNAPNAIALSGNVSRTQTWRNLGSGTSYDFLGESQVGNSAPITLTVAAGATLRFAPGKALLVGEKFFGDLILEGTAPAPVVLTKASPGTDAAYSTNWGGVIFESRASNASRLRHTVIEYGGDLAKKRAGLNLYPVSGSYAEMPDLKLLDHVTVRDSAYYGVLMDEDVGFDPSSNNLTITRSKLEPLNITANQVYSIPQTSTLTGNGRDAVRIDNGGVFSTQTWHKLEVPYLVNYLSIAGTAAPALTLEPGITVMVEQSIRVGSTSQERPGKLIARGTDGNRIRFTSAQQGPPTSGSWQGIHFFYADGSDLQYTRVEYAGASTNNTFATGTGNLNVYREIGPFVRNSQITLSSGCGVTVSDGSRPNTTLVTTEFNRASYFNSFGNTGAAQCLN